MTEQQQVAMIRTMLFFMGKSQYQPTSTAVLAELRQMTAGSGWDIAKNQAPNPVSTPAAGWNLDKGQKK